MLVWAFVNEYGVEMFYCISVERLVLLTKDRNVNMSWVKNLFETGWEVCHRYFKYRLVVVVLLTSRASQLWLTLYLFSLIWLPGTEQ